MKGQGISLFVYNFMPCFKFKKILDFSVFYVTIFLACTVGVLTVNGSRLPEKSENLLLADLS
jgi:hypothetical protein